MAETKSTENVRTVPGYKITVEGQYYAIDSNTGNKTLRFFKNESFEFPEYVRYKAGMKKIKRDVGNGQTINVVVPDIQKSHIKRVALHLIKTYYLKGRMESKYTDYSSAREVRIFAKEPVDVVVPPSSDIHNMEEADLLQFVALHDLNMSLSGYQDLGDKKLAVESAYGQKKQADQAAGKVKAVSDMDINMTDPDDVGIEEGPVDFDLSDGWE